MLSVDNFKLNLSPLGSVQIFSGQCMYRKMRAKTLKIERSGHFFEEKMGANTF